MLQSLEASSSRPAIVFQSEFLDPGNFLRSSLAGGPSLSFLPRGLRILSAAVAMLASNFLMSSQERYSSCLCLRNDGIELPTNHSSESGMEILVKVKNIFDELDADIPVAAIYCTHRIGRKTMDANEKHKQHVIVRFTTWKHRTAVYRARKKIKSVKFRLDLTKPRLNLLTSANNFLKNYKNFYAFADINLRMRAKIGNSFSFLDSISDLLSRIKIRSPLQVEDE